MKKHIALGVIILFFICTNSSAQSLHTEEQVGGTHNDYGSCIAVDRDGNRYMSGVFRGSSHFNTSTLYSSNVWTAYLAKYAPDGTFLWLQVPGVCADSLSDIYTNAIATDASGNIYLAGKYLGSAFFNNVSHTSQSSSEIYLEKIHSDGSIEWVSTAGGQGNGSFGQFSANAISLDASGNSYITGTYNTSVSFDTITLNSPSTSMLFYAKYNSGGKAVWAHSAFSNGVITTGTGIAAEPDGTTVFTGTFFDDVTIGTTNITVTDPERKMLVARCDADGNILWAKQIGTGGYYGNAMDIATDSTGNSYFCGSFRATINFPQVEYSYNVNYQYRVLVVKYDASGNIIWVTASDGANQSATPAKITADNMGNSFIAGSFTNALSFGNQTLSKPSGVAAFVSSLGTDGSFTWAAATDGTGNSNANGIIRSASGDVIIIGEFSDTISIGTKSLESIGGSDVFTASISTMTQGVDEQKTPVASTEFFPNPANTELRSSKIQPLVLSDVLGREIIRCADCDRLDVSAVPSGVYFISGKQLVIRH